MLVPDNKGILGSGVEAWNFYGNLGPSMVSFVTGHMCEQSVKSAFYFEH